MFKLEKTTQTTAYLLTKTKGKMHYKKLIRTLYVADRKNYEQWSEPLTWDKPISTKVGPALSETLKIMTGEKQSSIWNEYIPPIINEWIKLTEPFNTQKLDQLSKADKAILDEAISEESASTGLTYEGLLTRFPEWNYPTDNDTPIELPDILKNIGYSEKAIQEILEILEDKDAIARFTDSMEYKKRDELYDRDKTKNDTRSIDTTTAV